LDHPAEGGFVTEHGAELLSEAEGDATAVRSRLILACEEFLESLRAFGRELVRQSGLAASQGIYHSPNTDQLTRLHCRSSACSMPTPPRSSRPRRSHPSRRRWWRWIGDDARSLFIARYRGLVFWG
jgi:hypothetical protein